MMFAPCVIAKYMESRDATRISDKFLGSFEVPLCNLASWVLRGRCRQVHGATRFPHKLGQKNESCCAIFLWKPQEVFRMAPCGVSNSDKCTTALKELIY